MHLPVYANCGPAERAARIQSLVFPAILSDPLVRLVMKADGVDPARAGTGPLGHRRQPASQRQDRNPGMPGASLLKPSPFDVA